MRLILKSFVFSFFWYLSLYGQEINDCQRLASYPTNNDFEYGIFSIDTQQQALEIIEVCNKSIQKNPKNGENYLNLSRAYYFLEDYQKEIQLLNKAIENNYYDHVYYDLSDIYFNGQHDSKNHKPDIKKSIEILKEGDKKGDHFSQYLLGFYYLYGDFEEFLGPADLDKAIKYFEKSKSDNYYSFLEYVMRAMPLDDQATILNDVLKLYDENKILHSEPLGWTYYHLADIHSRTYRYREQIEAIENTIKYISRIHGEDDIYLTGDYQILAEAYMRQGLLGKADQILNHAFFILNSNDYTNFEYEYFELLYTLSELYIAQKLDEKAYKSLKEISDYFENSDRGFPLLEGYTYFYLADYFIHKGDLVRAEELITEAEIILQPYKTLSFYYEGFTEIKIDLLYLLKDSLKLNSFLDDYRNYFEGSKGELNKNQSSLLNYKYLISKYDYMNNNPQKCIKEISNNIILIKEIGADNSTFEFDNLIILGNCYQKLFKNKKAYETFILALKIQNNSNTIRDRFYPKHNLENIYEFVFDYSIKNKIFNEDLFEIIQLSGLEETSMAIDEMFIRENIQDVNLKDKLNQKKILQSSLNKINIEIINTRMMTSSENINQQKLFERKSLMQKELFSINDELTSSYPDLFDYINSKNQKISNIQTLLKKDEAILKFINISDKIYISYFDKENFFIEVAKQSYEKINNSIKKYRFFLENPSSKKKEFQIGFEIYTELLNPVNDLLKDKKDLYVIMTPLIDSLPLETLLSENPNSKNFDQMKWLINNFNFKYLPSIKSLNSLKLLETQKTYNLDFIGIGDPIIDTSQKENFKFISLLLRGMDNEYLNFLNDLPELPNTSDEIIQIGKNFNKKKILLRQDASEINIAYQDNSAKFIVFATHALKPYELGDKSLPGLVLSIPKTVKGNIDGLLTTPEIINSNFTSNLIVLSACNTAAGDLENLNSLSGLTKSFFFAGAKNIIATHWSVETYAAEITTTNLFSRLDNSFSKNLRDAKLDLLKNRNTSHPFFWAPFIFIGIN